MLRSIYIRNYALIEELDLEFPAGLSTITGETGAGKSILLGALGLALGNRADYSVLRDPQQKCIVECRFNIAGFQLDRFFSDNDLENDSECIIRREILPGGKSRAFINDSPVQLQVLKELTEHLIDIHSQHQTLLLREDNFQMQVLDTFSSTLPLLAEYTGEWKKWIALGKELAALQEEEDKAHTESGYLSFQLEEIREAAPRPGETEALEEEQRALAHADDIRTSLSQVLQIMDGSENSILSGLKEAVALLQKAGKFSSTARESGHRFDSALIELKDLYNELERLESSVDTDPERLSQVNERLDLLYSLLKKHKLENTTELLALEKELSQKLAGISSLQEKITAVASEQAATEASLRVKATRLSEERKKHAPLLGTSIRNILQELGMPEASLQIDIKPASVPGISGIDEVEFLFSANKGMPVQPMSRTASGGEISRLMLAIKALISEKRQLPSMILDEIDTGVSGNVADKMGQLLRSMADSGQVIAITHLPQVAGKGHVQFKVQKAEKEGRTVSVIRQLTSDERVNEIAQMLSGEKVSGAALENARELLGMNG